MTAETKPCGYSACEGVLTRRDRDGPSRWYARRFCSKRCAGKATAFHPAKLAGIQARYDRPGERERHAERRRQISVRTWADPVKRAAMTQAAADRIDQTLNSPHARALAASPETRAKAAASYSRTMRAWCPEGRWDEYKLLAGKVGHAEARRMIEADIPGTVEHAKRAVANVRDAMLIRREREKAQAY